MFGETEVGYPILPNKECKQGRIENGREEGSAIQFARFMQSKRLRRYYKRGFPYNIIENPPLIGKLHYDRMPLSNEMGEDRGIQ